MIRTDCDMVRDILPEHLSGVRGEARPDLDLHLAVCAECRADAEIMELLMRAAVPAPAGLHERVIGAVHASEAPARWPYRAAGKTPARWPYRAALLAAASVVALLGARALLVQSGESAEPLSVVGTSAGAQAAPNVGTAAGPQEGTAPGPQAVKLYVQPSSETPRPPSGTEARSLMQPFPGSGPAMASHVTTLNDLSEEQLKSLIAEL